MPCTEPFCEMGLLHHQYLYRSRSRFVVLHRAFRPVTTIDICCWLWYIISSIRNSTWRTMDAVGP
jgi:hypothetical protein